MTDIIRLYLAPQPFHRQGTTANNQTDYILFDVFGGHISNQHLTWDHGDATLAFAGLLHLSLSTFLRHFHHGYCSIEVPDEPAEGSMGFYFTLPNGPSNTRFVFSCRCLSIALLPP